MDQAVRGPGRRHLIRRTPLMRWQGGGLDSGEAPRRRAGFPEVSLSPSPDLRSDRRLAWTTAAVTVVVIGVLSFMNHDIGRTLGDTDDAMRIAMVRHLLEGGGWYDQLVTRLQPPQGIYLHWSRLVDGALAGLIGVLGLVMPEATAEAAVRFAWPLLWIAPAVVCALAIARRTGAAAAVFVCAAMLIVNIQMFTQFQPGRIDHHDIQIVAALVAAASALARRRRVLMAAIAGAATAVGLAVGMEALVFVALVGVSFALRAALAPQSERGPVQAYGLTLAGATALLFALQTPPWRWSVSACDALGVNLIAALAVAGLGLAAVVAWAERLPVRLRLGLVAAVGLAALAVYLAFDPSCVRGPFAAVDPRVRPFWFDHIKELEPWWRLVRTQPSVALELVMVCLASAAAATWLAVRQVRARDWNGLLAVALCLAAVAEAALAYRAEGYVLWFGMPLIAAAISLIGERLWRNLMIPTLAAALVSPLYLAALLSLALPQARATEKLAKATIDHCFETAAFQPLAKLPAGVVLSEIDLGPFVLADTPHAALSAPYHRMTWGILAAHDALAAGPGEDERRARALNVRYVLDCPAHGLAGPPSSLEQRLRRGETPGWLERLSPAGAPIQIWRVRAG